MQKGREEIKENLWLNIGSNVGRINTSRPLILKVFHDVWEGAGNNIQYEIYYPIRRACKNLTPKNK